MTIDDRVIARIKALIEDGNQMVQEQERPSVGLDPIFGWVVSVTRAVEVVCGDSDARYLKAVEEVKERDVHPLFRVEQLVPLLTNLLSDVEAGMLASVADQARAEVFDDFLDVGEQYLDMGHIPQARVIVSVVFEDTLKKICRKHGFDAPAKATAETLINLLKSKGRLSSNKAKGAKRAADLRNAALHASWQEFDVHDLKASLDFTRQLIAQELDN